MGWMKRAFFRKLVLPFCALASPSQATPRAFEGLHLSFALGSVWAIGERQLSCKDALTSVKHEKSLTDYGLIGGLGLTYQWRFPRCLSLGLELYGTVPSLRFGEPQNTARPFVARTRGEGGMRVKPGFLLSRKTLLYGLLGCGVALVTQGAFLEPPYDVTKKVLGISYGVGVLTRISPKLSLGLEFLRNNYERLNISRASHFFPGVRIGYALKMNTDALMLRLSYTF